MSLANSVMPCTTRGGLQDIIDQLLVGFHCGVGANDVDHTFVGIALHHKLEFVVLTLHAPR